MQSRSHNYTRKYDEFIENELLRMEFNFNFVGTSGKRTKKTTNGRTGRSGIISSVKLPLSADVKFSKGEKPLSLKADVISITVGVGEDLKYYRKSILEKILETVTPISEGVLAELNATDIIALRQLSRRFRSALRGTGDWSYILQRLTLRSQDTSFCGATAPLPLRYDLNLPRHPPFRSMLRSTSIVRFIETLVAYNAITLLCIDGAVLDDRNLNPKWETTIRQDHSVVYTAPFLKAHVTKMPNLRTLSIRHCRGVGYGQAHRFFVTERIPSSKLKSLRLWGISDKPYNPLPIVKDGIIAELGSLYEIDVGMCSGKNPKLPSGKCDNVCEAKKRQCQYCHLAEESFLCPTCLAPNACEQCEGYWCRKCQEKEEYKAPHKTYDFLKHREKADMTAKNYDVHFYEKYGNPLICVHCYPDDCEYDQKVAQRLCHYYHPSCFETKRELYCGTCEKYTNDCISGDSCYPYCDMALEILELVGFKRCCNCLKEYEQNKDEIWRRCGSSCLLLYCQTCDKNDSRGNFSCLECRGWNNDQNYSYPLLPRHYVSKLQTKGKAH